MAELRRFETVQITFRSGELPNAGGLTDDEEHAGYVLVHVHIDPPRIGTPSVPCLWCCITWWFSRKGEFLWSKHVWCIEKQNSETEDWVCDSVTDSVVYSSTA